MPRRRGVGGGVCPRLELSLGVRLAAAVPERPPKSPDPTSGCGVPGNVWTPELIQGTASGSPVDPTVTEDSLVLARLLVRDSTEAGGTIVRPQDITDLRVHARAAGGVTPVATLGSWPNPQAFDFVWSIADTALYMRTPSATWMKVGSDIDAPWITYTPALNAVNPGTTGGQYLFGRYKRLGKTVVVEAGFRFGTDGVLAASPPIGIGLPSNANFSAGVTEYLFGARMFAGAGATNNGNWGGLGAVVPADPDMVINFATAGTLGWTVGTPTLWEAGTPGDGMTMFGVYEEA